MKRIISVFLTVVMLMSLCLTAFAVDSEIPYEKFFYSIFEPEAGNPDMFKHPEQATDPDSFYELIKNIGEKSKELKGEDVVYLRIYAADFLSHEEHCISHGGKYPEDDGQYRSCYNSCLIKYMTRVFDTEFKFPDSFIYESVLPIKIAGYIEYKVKSADISLDTVGVIASSAAIEKIHFVSEEKIEIGLPTYTPLHPYNDIKPDAWYYDYVTKVYDMKLMFGTTSTTFEPNATLTRAMLVTMIGRFEERLNGDLGKIGENTFSDVKKEKWYTDYVIWAAEKGVVEGYPDGTFRPNAPVTREEAVTILGRYYDKSAPGMIVIQPLEQPYYPHTDTDKISDWAEKWVRLGMSLGAVHFVMRDSFGKPETAPEYYFRPVDTITRAEAAKVAYVFLSNLEISIERGHRSYKYSGLTAIK